MAATQLDWRERARQFAETVVRPIAESMDREDRMPAHIWEELGKAGFTGLGLPPRWGGRGGGAVDVVAALEEFSRASAAVATELAVHLSVAAMPIAQWGTDAQKEKFLRPLAEGRELGAFALTEPGTGSDAAGLTTRYTVADDAVVLRGSKMFITNGASADLVLVFATRDPTLGHRGISAFLLPKGLAGFTVAQRLDKLGLRGSETTELVLQDVRLPLERRLGAEGEGLRIALSALAGGRVGIAACAAGIATAAFEEMVRAAKADPADWKRSTVARSYSELAAARALIHQAAREKDAGEEYVRSASAAKLVASTAAVRIAHAAFEVVGPEAQRAGSTAERLLRDARVFPIVEGTTEIQELILGRELVGRSERTDLPRETLSNSPD
ncbi:MAG TPA: acyl-CoA dehydrogenase family protein [Thermoplasmata archaeon]|nr:acyl-CoA dehydrogenase family protein [Thermoplasmata archaeon]